MEDTNQSASELEAEIAKSSQEAKAEVVEPESQEVPSESSEVLPEKSEEPRKFAGKFNSVEDLEKSYLEAEKKMHQSTEQLAQAKKSEAEELYPLEDTPIPEDETVQQLNQYVQPLVQQQVRQITDPLVANLEIREAKAKYGDKFEELKPRIVQVFREYPELAKPGNLDRAIRIAKADLIEETELQAKNEGIKQGLAKADEISKAQTESPKGSGDRRSKVQLSDEVLDKMSASELEEYLSNK